MYIMVSRKLIHRIEGGGATSRVMIEVCDATSLMSDGCMVLPVV